MDPLYGAKLKIKWAHHYIYEINAAITRFLATQPSVFIKKIDPNTTEEVAYVRLTRPLPEEVTVYVSHVVHGARSALDHLAYALAVKSSASEDSLRNVYFPIAESPDALNAPFNQRKVAMLSDDAKRFILAQKPYKGGDNLLWALNTLDVMDKHKTVVSASVSLAPARIEESSVHPFTVSLTGIQPALDKDVEVYRHPANTGQQVKAQVRIMVLLSDIYPGQDTESVAQTLFTMVRRVEEIVISGEARFFG